MKKFLFFILTATLFGTYTMAMASTFTVQEHVEQMPAFNSQEKAAFEITSDNPQQAIHIMRIAIHLQQAGIKTTVLFKRNAVPLLDIRKDDPRKANPNSWNDESRPQHNPYPAPKISAVPPQTTANLIQHVIYHVKLGGTVFVCPKCMQAFAMNPAHLPELVIFKPELTSRMLPNAIHLQ